MVAMSQIGRKLARKRARKAAEDSAYRPRLTGAEGAARLVQSGAFGAWAHREDIEDSSAYARQLRKPHTAYPVLNVEHPYANP